MVQCRLAAAVLGATVGAWCGLAEAATTRVESVKSMLALTRLDDGAVLEVQGYRRPGDDGGGVFTYASASGDEPDGGTVLTPAALPGRFLRQIPENVEPRAEWFGAHGDGQHPDQAAINACLKRFQRVRLLPKTYALGSTPPHYDPDVTYHSIDLRTGYRIEGTGRDKTTLRLLDATNPRGADAGSNYFIVIYNARFHDPADNIVVRDLTIDCNFDGQNKHTTIHAVHVRGGNALIERLNLRGYGTGRHPTSGYSRECFVVAQTLVYKHATGSRRAATLRDLDFTDPGHNGEIEGKVAEITHIALGGAGNFSDFSWIVPKGKDPDFDPENNGENDRNWWPSEGGLVEHCRIHDMVFEPSSQKSPLHGITISNADGMVVRNNVVENVDGAAVFTMSWHHRNTHIHDNVFTNVYSGLALHVKGSDGKPLQFPKHENVRFERNRIVLGTPKHIRWSPIGVQLYGQDLGNAPRLVNILVKDNHIEGRSFLDAAGKRRYPVGVSVQVLRDNLRGVRFENNVIEVPDVPEESVCTPNVPYGLAMRYFPLARWEADCRSGNIAFAGNRTPGGQALRPSLADWYFKNDPLWGNPDGSTTPAPK